ncbi:MAG: hypothetical protein ACPGUV_11475 [Polyangiales bacterium]
MRRRRLGRMLVEEGHLSEGQLALALTQQMRLRSCNLADVLVDLGLLSAAALAAHQAAYLCFLHSADVPRYDFMAYLVSEGLLSAAALHRATEAWRRRQAMRLGDIVVDLGLLGQARLDAIIARQLGEVTVALP